MTPTTMAPARSAGPVPLATWFTLPVVDVAGPDPASEAVRVRILVGVCDVVRFGVDGQHVVVESPTGKTMIERQGDLARLEHVDVGGKARQTFWMNAVSLGNISAALQSVPQRRRGFMAVLEGRECPPDWESNPVVRLLADGDRTSRYLHDHAGTSERNTSQILGVLVRDGRVVKIDHRDGVPPTFRLIR